MTVGPDAPVPAGAAARPAGTRAGLARLRLRNQRLAGPPLPSPAEAVRWLGAVQAQENAIARWSLGERADGAVDSDVERALADGSVLRTHLLRPTWHFVHAADIRWIQALTGPRVHVQNGHRYRALGLDEALFARSQQRLVDALAGGAHLTRAEIRELFRHEGIDTEGQRLAYLLMRAELDALICSGSPRGKQHTYALLDERVPPAAPLDPDEALAELAWRFFRSHGPATIKDFRWWSSLTVAQIRRGIELLGARLGHVEVDGRTLWFAPGTALPEPDPADPPTAHLLQGYDEYVVAYSETKDVFDGVGPGGSFGGLRVPFLHAVLMDGRVVGHWRRTLTARRVSIEVQLRRPLHKAERDALHAAAERYGRFLGLTAEWNPV